jgi:hypothetical protein
VRTLLLAAVTTALLVAQPLRAGAQAQSAPPAGNRQQQQCQKLGEKVNRLKAGKNGLVAADHAYASGITKLSKRYGYDPCPGLKAPNV